MWRRHGLAIALVFLAISMAALGAARLGVTRQSAAAPVLSAAPTSGICPAAGERCVPASPL